MDGRITVAERAYPRENVRVTNHEPAPRLEIKGVRKEFPGVRALNWREDDRLDIRPGEIHALVGENGAGKSTLIQIAGGIYQPNGGALTLDGAPYCPRSVDDAWDHGVALVLQEPALIPSLTVGENVYLGQEQAFTRLGVLWPPTRDRQARAALEDVGLGTSPRAIVSDLSYEERKLVEVARAVSLHPKVLVIDETTASLSHQGTQLLYRQIRRLRDAGTAIIYISHYLEEVFELCDRVSVLKDGQLVGTWDIGEMSIERLSHAMVGRDLDLHAARSDQRELYSDRAAQPILAVSNLSKEGSFTDITFDVSPGEIVGIGGIVGCGSLEVGRCLFGALTADTGTIAVQNRPVTPRNPRDGVRLGIGYVPKERDEEGLILPFSIRDNVALAVLDQMRRLGLISPATEERLVQGAIRRYRVKAEGTGTVCLNLSGGNRQKVVLAKWLATGAKVLILNSPTRGIDIGAKAEVYAMMRDLAAEGTAILMITDELPELIAMSDRILIMRRGSISGHFHRDQQPTEEQLIQYMV
jgi:ABC-type sugar transport system ATPase subunit